MSPPPATPAPEPPSLFMVEVPAADWPAAVHWYTACLGLRGLLRDDRNGFALLGAGAAKVALKRVDSTILNAPGPPRPRLVFEVPDVDAARDRLLALGVPVGPAVDYPAEEYREVRLADPEGTPITLFGWVERGTGPEEGPPPPGAVDHAGGIPGRPPPDVR